MSNDEKFHWYLFCGMSALGFHNVPIACSTKDEITDSDLEYAKSVLNKRAKECFNQDVNVCISSISYLGHMSKKQFYKK